MAARLCLECGPGWLMHAAGYPCYLSANGVWLTEHVPVAYLGLPPDQERTQNDIITDPT